MSMFLGLREENEVYVFDSKIFKILLFGGACEFLGSTMILCSYRSALLASINQGLCSAILSCNGIFAAIASYLIYRERIFGVQLFGIFVCVIGLVLIVVYQDTTSYLWPYP